MIESFDRKIKVLEGGWKSNDVIAAYFSLHNVLKFIACPRE
jgi:hypothetical protein